MYVEGHEPLPHPDPGPGEPTEQYAGNNLPVVNSPSIKPGPYDASNADKRFNLDLDEAMEKLRKIIKK